MACINFMQLFSRRCLSTNAYNSSILFKNDLNAKTIQNTYRYLYLNRTKVTSPKQSTKLTSFYCSKLNDKILVTICVRHSTTLRNSRYFHTSEHRYLNPIVWTVLRPLLKFLAVLTGRGIRKWWRDLPPNKKKYFLQEMKRNKFKIALFAAACVTLSVIYYVSHLEEAPITKRRRFMAFNAEQLKQMNKFEFQQIMEKLRSQILPANHPSTLRVKKIVNRILEANKDLDEIKGKTWGIAVVDSSIENAFVIPLGHVFVFTGMLALCSNDDELACILSHEIAHCLQNHGAENVSFAHLLDLISISIITAIWAIIPSDSLSLLTHWLYHKCMQIFFELPYNRSIEAEADVVGLHLAAKACFDIRESSAFWSKMDYLHSITETAPNIEFLSTHPSHAKRSEYLDGIMDQAIKIRNDCGCPKLKSTDPRLNVEVMGKALDAARRKYLQQYPKPITTIYI